MSSTTVEPGSATPGPKINRIGLTVIEYKGGKTTLCAGCGHNAISERIVEAMYEMGVEPEFVIKPSGIGCSSKTPAYFLSRSHSFNAVHGRMPSVATGAMLANRKLICIGVSGDGDTASIGIGQFVHLMRRNLPIIYIIEDNGVYGLTKGQFSATADLGSKLKTGVLNDLPPIDTCALAIQLGATLVGRSFSGDKRQLSAMLKAAIAHKGTVMLDVVSPCVTFNDHEGSTKSYKYVKEHEESLQEVSFVPHFEDINVEYDPGSTISVTMHDGSHLQLRKLEENYDPTDKIGAITRLTEAHDKGEVLTGVFYVNPTAPSFIDMLNVTDQPLATLPDSLTRPGKEVLDACMEELR
ncbi:MAG TPA: 2-oxoacid:ferredoxin oxidoreductase subunit beta [Candidatus Acidoferrales bacterium]|nr:2-oxoacid:ferredoxin oxidoreductase subunit beta [Candidatus Acidoferrales bacterium]